MISKGSRYARASTYMVEDPARSEQPIEGVAPHLPSPVVVRRKHRMLSTDRLDQLANRFYREPRRYWLICDANPVIFPDELLVAGRTLAIPTDDGR